MFDITSKAPVFFGSGASEQTGERVSALGCKKVFLVYDPGIKDAGIADKVIDSLKTAGIEVVEFSQVVPDPPDYVIEQAAEIARKEEVDGVIAVGGGSSMDTVKGVNVLLTNPSPISQYYGLVSGINPGKTMVLIPTTAGTGSEISMFAVISDTKNHIKTAIGGQICVPHLALIDPELTLGLPARPTAETGIDTFSHAVESLTSIAASPMTDILNEKCLELSFNNLPKAVQNGSDLIARENLSLAAMLAPMAFNDALIHLGHTIAHAIGAATHVTHGTCCAIATPITIEYLADILPEKIRRIGEILGLGLKDNLSPEELGKEVAAGFRAFCKGIGLPTTLKEANIEEGSIDAIIALVDQDSQIFSPKKISQQDALAFLKQGY